MTNVKASSNENSGWTKEESNALLAGVAIGAGSMLAVFYWIGSRKIRKDARLEAEYRKLCVEYKNREND